MALLVETLRFSLLLLVYQTIYVGELPEGKKFQGLNLKNLIVSPYVTESVRGLRNIFQDYW